MYNKFDRIKISCELTDITIKHEFFKKKLSPDFKEIQGEEFECVGLRIYANYKTNRLFIDFSAKILGNSYPLKINILNIIDVYKSISQYINIKPSLFLKLTPHYTETVSDINVHDIPTSITILYSMAKYQNNFKTSPKMFKHQGYPTSFSLKKNVLTRESLEYISIYNKSVELFHSKKMENLMYLETLTMEEQEQIKSYFQNKIRIEYKCNSKQKIRSSFNLGKDYNFYELLKSNVNVNENVMNRLYDLDLLPKFSYKELTYKHLDKLNTLKVFNYDLEKIYEAHKNMGGKIQKSKLLRPYKEIIKLEMKVQENEKLEEIKQIKEKLKW